MHQIRRYAPAIVALVLGIFCSSCLARVRLINRKRDQKTGKVLSLKTATRDELNARVQRIYGCIDTFQATVDMTPSVGSVYKGAITEYKDVRGFVLFRKEADIRIIAQYPVVRTTAFDMVSNGSDFRFYLVAKNLFVTGSNTAPATSKNTLENLRPEAFLNSMLVRPAKAGIEEPVLMDVTDEENATYILLLTGHKSNGELMLRRSIWFDRTDLTITRQVVYDDSDLILSDTRYGKWQPRDGCLFPAHIDINRDKDGYGVVMDVMDMKMHVTMGDDKFVLNQPEGTTHQVIGATGSTR
jgi:hypothetical protein